MALELFDFPYHTVVTENPESGLRVQLGSSYIFSAPPTDPDQRKMTLTFTGMKFYIGEDGYPEATTEPKRNMMKLIQFYQNHKLYKSFQYHHPVHGFMEVKFNSPLKEEMAIIGGTGVIKEFSIELVEIP